MLRVSLPITCKQLLETRNLQKHVRHKPANKNGLDKNKETKQNTHVYLLFDGIGPPCPGLKKHLSLLDGGAMAQCRWRRGSVGGLRDKGSQGIHMQHNSMQGRSVLRVTPHPPFIAFFGVFRVLSP